MRQAGIIAAGALYALDHHIDRLAEDHANARILAEAIRDTPGLRLDPEIIDTNIVIFEIDPELGTAAAFCARLRDEGVWMNATAPQRIRAVTHLDVSREQVHARGIRGARNNGRSAIGCELIAATGPCHQFACSAAHREDRLPMNSLPQIRLRTFFLTSSAPPWG